MPPTIVPRRIRTKAEIAARLLAGALLIVVLATTPARAEIDPATLLSAVIGVKAEVPSDARTAAFLGTTREGSGVVIDSDGLVLTIGYLILEASSASVVVAGGEEIPATVIAYDHENGFGLLRAARPPKVTPMEFGDSTKVRVDDRVLVAAHGAPYAVRPAKVVSRRDFAGYWEYLLENAIFTSPPHPAFGGAALIDAGGRLVGIGSLIVPDARGPGSPVHGNMFVPIDRLKQVLGALLENGRPSGRSKPWIGIFTQEARGHLFVTSVAKDGPAAKAGIEPNDIVLGVADQPIADQADFYRKMWKLGAAGVDVPLVLLKGARTRRVTVSSGDRYDWLKLKPTY
ncbi:MAG: S1C family serine protease [Alphaproteobacteria bacterium]